MSYTLGGQRRVSTAEVERIKNRTSPTRAERVRQQTHAAREARAARRTLALTPYTDIDEASFYNDEVNPILQAFKGFVVNSEEA